MHQALLLGAASTWQASALGTISNYQAPTTQNYPKYKAHIEVAFIRDHFLYNKQERDWIEKSGEPHKLSREYENSLRPEGPVNTIFYDPFYLHRLEGGYIQYSGLNTRSM